MEEVFFVKGDDIITQVLETIFLNIFICLCLSHKRIQRLSCAADPISIATTGCHLFRHLNETHLILCPI